MVFRKRSYLLSIFLLLVFPLALYPQTPESPASKPSALIFSIENVSGAGGEELEKKIYAVLSSVFKNSGRVEYMGLDAAETKLKSLGLENALKMKALLDSQTLAKLGHILRTDLIVTSTITVYAEAFEKRRAQVFLQADMTFVDVQKDSSRTATLSAKSDIQGKKMGGKAKDEALAKLAGETLKAVLGESVSTPSIYGEVFGKKSSKQVHLKDVKHAPPEGDQEIFPDLQTAISHGYKPCRICFPKEVGSTEEAGGLEGALGQEISGYIEHFYRIYVDKDFNERVNTAGNKIVSVTARPRLRYIFSILNSDEINAFAAGAGYVYVTKGILDIAESEAELAAVLAHEIGHVVRKHIVTQYNRAQRLSFLGAVGTILSGGSINLAVDFAQALIMNGYDRKFEREADQLALIYLIKAGYPAEDFINVLYKLQDMEKSQPSKIEVYFRSHPPTSERIKNAQTFLTEWNDLLKAIDKKVPYIFDPS